MASPLTSKDLGHTRPNVRTIKEQIIETLTEDDEPGFWMIQTANFNQPDHSAITLTDDTRLIVLRILEIISSQFPL